jgi:hypothetical protein
VAKKADEVQSIARAVGPRRRRGRAILVGGREDSKARAGLGRFVTKTAKMMELSRR